MPRKQRFKPSRKPKAVGTLSDLTPVEQSAEGAVPKRTPEVSTSDVEGILERGRQETDTYAKQADLGGESG
jgi:hypothetical protein